MASLQSLLGSFDQSVRLKAALDAGTYPQVEFIKILIKQSAHEKDFYVRETLCWALMRNDRQEVVKQLIPELKSNIAQARSQAVHTFTKIGDKQYYPLISHELLFDSEDFVAMTAWRAASLLVPDEQVNLLATILLTQLGRGNIDVQLGLSRSLCALGTFIIERLEEAAKSPNKEISVHAQFTAKLFRHPELEKDYSLEYALRIAALKDTPAQD